MMLALGLWTAMACVPVEGDRVLARDVAAAVPALAQWPPDTELGFTPAPGLQRVFRPAELQRLARRQGRLADSLPEFCVERPAAPLAPEVLQASLAAATADPEARVELLDWSRYPVPHGPLEFPRASAVSEGTGSAVLWKGFVRYGEHGRFAIWARARIEVRAPQVSAGEELAAGRPIQPGQLRLATVTRPLFGQQPASTLAEAVGRVPRRPVPAGALVYLNQLDVPLAIHSGDPVTVQVTSGLAHIILEGIAGGDGRGGDLIPVRNALAEKLFAPAWKAPGKWPSILQQCRQEKNDMFRRPLTLAAVLVLASAAGISAKKKPQKPPEPSPLDRYITEAMRSGALPATDTTPGSLWSGAAPLLNLTSELRASHVNDVITVQVNESASAATTGATKTGRTSSASSAITALGGVTKATGPLANLANLSGTTTINGQGTTSRDITFSTTITARVTHVLPNGYMVVEGSKDIDVNSERQLITVRGVVRPIDLSPANVVLSNHLGQMEIRLNGKGVVGDAIRQPFILYRLLMGLLPL
jgi:flagellar L-ring protein FlgH